MASTISSAATRAALFIVLCSPFAAAQTPRFSGVGLLPDGTTSGVYGLSRDGTTAVGQSDGPTTAQAIQWTQSGGLRAFGAPMGSVSHASATSANGSVTVGGLGLTAVSWFDPATPTQLPPLPGGNAAGASAVSADGQIIAGGCQVPALGGTRAVRWTNGVPQNLGALPGGANASAGGISDDGNVVVGDSKNAANQDRAFRWTQATGMLDLGTLPGGDSSFASAASADGSVIVGSSSMPTILNRAFRWTAATGIQDLGALPGGVSSVAYAVTPDGNSVGGFSLVAGSEHAFLWTLSGGMRDLNTVLPALGLDLTGWTLTQVRGISADGLTMAGVGFHQAPGGGRYEGWVATIPAPSVLSALGAIFLAGLGRRPAHHRATRYSPGRGGERSRPRAR